MSYAGSFCIFISVRSGQLSHLCHERSKSLVPGLVVPSRVSYTCLEHNNIHSVIIRG